MGEVSEHDVVAAGREPDRAVRGDVEPARDLAHLQYAVLRIVSWTSTVAKSAEPPVRRSAVAPCSGSSYKGRRPRRPWGSRGPRASDHDVPGLELLGEGRSEAEGEGKRQGEM